MKPARSNAMLIIRQSVGALIFLCATPLYAAIGIAGILYGLSQGLGLHERFTWVDWVIVSPIIYVTWLNLFLIACALDIQGWRLYLGYQKPRRLTDSGGFRNWLQFHLVLLSYMRQRIVRHLPLVQGYLGIEGLRHLVLWAGASSARVGARSFLFGHLYDPELTEIGEDAVLGAESAVTAHAMTTNPDGSRVYVTAPVTIGPRAVVGGGARIDLGARIGADAIVEPMSYVAPFTVIGDGEVWGGNPAQFKRNRFDSPIESIGCAPIGAVESAATVDLHGGDEALRLVVATALDVSPDQISLDLNSSECAAWDSLGQMAIAAGLHDRFGIILSADESFRLKSMRELREVVASRSSGVVNGLPAPQIEHTGAPVETVLPDDPELLPLLDHELATRLLAVRGSDPAIAASARQPLTVVIAATFVAEPLASSLKLWAQAFGIPFDVRFAGFNQVHQCLIDPTSEFHQNETGINLVLARPEDLFPAAGAHSDEVARSLLTAIAAFAERSPGTLVVGSLPPVVSTFCTADRMAVDALRAEWRRQIGQMGGVGLLEFSEIVEHIGVGSAGRPDMEAVARAPYTARVYQELGIAVARLTRQQRVAPAKVLALDADGVLWGGVLGEDGASGIQLGSDSPGRSFQLFQRQIRRLQERGCLLVLVSRNDPEDVWRVLDEHPEMVLRRKDFAAARINWLPKSQNLKDLAAELNLGLDAFVFVDDDPANRAEVAANAPGVTVLPLPADPALYCRVLSQLWRFDSPHVTREDQDRLALMQAENERRRHRDANADLTSYLKSLELRVTMRLACDADWPRVSQLTQKTNQFNLSLKRRSLPEIQTLATTHSIFVVESSDRFGDYGLIGAAILSRDAARPDEFVLDTLLMSCRALGRGIEDAVLHGLCSIVAARGGRRLIAPFVAGPRNQPCLDFLNRANLAERAPREFELAVSPVPALPGHIAWQDLDAGTESRAA